MECPDADCPTMSGNFIVGERGDAVQSGVVNQNESRDLGNTNTNIVLPNTTALTSLIKTQDLPSPRPNNRGKMCVSWDL